MILFCKYLPAIVYNIYSVFSFLSLHKINVIEAMNALFSRKNAKPRPDKRRTFKMRRAQRNQLETLKEIAAEISNQ